jgi:uncharacterized lipoprotein YajG
MVYNNNLKKMKMKNRITILIAFVISSMLVASCSKKDTTDNTPQPKETPLRKVCL